MNYPSYKIGKLTFIDKSKMTLQQWVNFRMFGLGGSDTSSILDLNPHASITELFYEKIGYKDPVDLTDNENVFWGSLHESNITTAANFYDLDSSDRKNYTHNYAVNKQQRNILDLNYIVKHDDYPWLMANLDGITFQEHLAQEELDLIIRGEHELPVPEQVHENKFMTGFTSDKWDLGLPIGYVSQVMTYKIPFHHLNNDISSIIWTLKDGNYLEPYPIPFSQIMFDKIVKKCSAFWELVKQGKKILSEGLSVSETDHLLSDIAPRPENITPAYDEYLSKRLKERDKNKMAGLHEQYKQARVFNSLNYLKKQIEVMATVESALLKEFMDKNDVRIIEFNEKERIVWNRRFYTDTIESNDLYGPAFEELEGVLIKYGLYRKNNVSIIN